MQVGKASLCSGLLGLISGSTAWGCCWYLLGDGRSTVTVRAVTSVDLAYRDDSDTEN